MADLEKDIPTLEFCSLRQALDWILADKKPIAANFEKLLRDDIPKYNMNFGHKKIREFASLLLTDKFTMFARKGVMDGFNDQRPNDIEFIPNDKHEKITSKNFVYDFIDWDRSAIYNSPDVETNSYGMVESFSGIPTDALGEIEIPFSEIQEYKKSIEKEYDTTDRRLFWDRFELFYKNDTVYLRVNGENMFELKTLRTGKAKQIFEYIYNNPDKELLDTDIAKVLNIKWTGGDRLDQIVRNIVELEPFIKKWFPICKTHEIKFKPIFYLSSRNNQVELEDVIDEIPF